MTNLAAAISFYSAFHYMTRQAIARILSKMKHFLTRDVMRIKATIASLMGAAALFGVGVTHAFMPQAGTWIVTSENNGQPGRGFGLDVQNTTLVMQMYGYEANGAPTFYLSAGSIVNDAYTGQMNQYAGGPSLGGAPRSGYETGSAGVVKMRFVSGTKGFITFPGESEKEISRYDFAYSTSPASLKGIWLFSPLNSTTPASDFARLETIGAATSGGTGVIVSTDGRIACEHQVSSSLAGTVLCVRVTTAGKLERGYQFAYSVNEGEGLYINSAGSATSIAVMRRLGNASDTGTGILLKKKPENASAEDMQTNIELLRTQIEALAVQVELAK